MTYELLVSFAILWSNDGATFNILATKKPNNQKCSSPRPGLQRHILRIDCGCHHAYHVYHSANPMRSWGQTKALLRPADLRVTLIPVTSIDMSGHCIIDLKIMINSSKTDQIRSEISSQAVYARPIFPYMCRHPTSDFLNHTLITETDCSESP